MDIRFKGSSNGDRSETYGRVNLSIMILAIVAPVACAIASASDLQPAKPTIKGGSSTARKPSTDIDLPILSESAGDTETSPDKWYVKSGSSSNNSGVSTPSSTKSTAAKIPSPKIVEPAPRLAEPSVPKPKSVPVAAAPAGKKAEDRWDGGNPAKSRDGRERDAGTVKSYRDRAAESAGRGKWSEAEDLLRQALRLDPQNADVVLELANALAEQGKDEPMMAVLLGYAGEDPRVTQMLGEAYVSGGRLKEAEQTFMDLSLRQPAEPYHRYNLGLVEYRMGKLDMAENAYLRAVELDPQFSDAHYNLALLYIRNKEYPKALSHLEEAVRLREDADYLINYGVVLREMNRFDASQAALEHALSLDAGNTLALNNLGITHYLAGHTGDAKRAFTKTLELAPDDATAKSFLAKISSEPPSRRTTSPAPAVSPAPAELPTAEAAPAPTPSVSTVAQPPRVPPAPRSVEPVQPSPPSQKITLQPQIVDSRESRDMQSDLQRLQQENKDLKDRLADVEKKMDDIRQGVYRQTEETEKQESARIGTALKKAQDVLDKKEKELKKKPPEDRSMSSEIPASGDAAVDERIEELQRTLADARSELEDMRQDRPGAGFPPEPGSTEDRLNAADRAVQSLQQQIRQMSIERDMLRAEIESMRSGVPVAAMPSGGGRANINLADLGGLLLIPGMEERLAHNILWYRQNIGPFRSASDLKKVPGMDEAHYAQMIDHVSVGMEAGH